MEMEILLLDGETIEADAGEWEIRIWPPEGGEHWLLFAIYLPTGLAFMLGRDYAAPLNASPLVATPVDCPAPHDEPETRRLGKIAIATCLQKLGCGPGQAAKLRRVYRH